MRTLTLLALFSALPAFAQYNAQAGRSRAESQSVTIEKKDANGNTYFETRDLAPPRDGHNNAQGQQYDLAVDGAFDGQTVLVIDLYGQPMGGPRSALKAKGFSMVRHQSVPPLAEFKALLAKSNQLWVLASCDDRVHLSEAHQQAVLEFFDSGHGVYLWGDNDPCNADANALARLLVKAGVKGDLPGDRTVGLSTGRGKPGMVQDHLLSTGVEHIYEGITVATVQAPPSMTPIVWGSAGNLVTAAYEHDGKRLIVDGGYTRLDYRWDSAGTGRYVKNAAAWLANHERFGNQVVADRFRK